MNHVTSTLRGAIGSIRIDGSPTDAPPRRIVFVSGRCLFRYEAMLDLMAYWARGRSNREHAISRITDVRSDLARGADRASSVRSLMHLFEGADEHDAIAATRSYLRGVQRWPRRPGPSSAWAELSGAGTEVVLISDLALFSLHDELPGVDAVISSTPASAGGRLTGEIALVLSGVQQRNAMAGFAAERGVPLSECTFLHRGDPAAPDGVGTSVDLLVRTGPGSRGERIHQPGGISGPSRWRRDGGTGTGG